MPCPLSSQCPVQWLAQGGRQHCRQQGQAGVSLAFGRILGHLDPPLQCFSIPGRGGSCRHIPIQFPLCGLPGLSSHQPPNFVFPFIAQHLSQHQELGHTCSPGPSWPQHLQATPMEIPHLVWAPPAAGAGSAPTSLCRSAPPVFWHV